MRRKVIQIADSTQLVSLPRKWALKYGIKKGDEIEIEEKGEKLIINSEKGLQLHSVEIDITGLDRTSILYYIEILYRIGYDEIRVKYNQPYTEHFRLKKKENIISVLHYVATRLIGMEIIEQKNNIVVMKSLEHVSAKEFNTALNRIFMLLQDTSEDFIRGAQKGDMLLLETIESKHDSIAKFINYTMRILNTKGPGDNRNSFLLFHILNQLDKITDVIKYSARELYNHKKPLSSDALDIITQINKSIHWYVEFFLKFDRIKIRDLYQNRDSTIRKIRERMSKFSSFELLLVEYFRHILEYITDITETRMGLEY